MSTVSYLISQFMVLHERNPFILPSSLHVLGTESNQRGIIVHIKTQSNSELRKGIVEQEVNRASSEVKRDKSEICVSAKEKTADLNSQGNGQRHFADIVKFGQFYGHLPPQCFDQFSGLPMQHHPLYVGSMFPPIPLPPEAHFPYYSYMYPPAPLTLANPHVYSEPLINTSGKRERISVETDRKECREAESEIRERNEISQKDGSPKTWRAEAPETTRKESVIKSVVKETAENERALNDQRTNREVRTDYSDRRSAKLDYQRKDDREGMVPSSAGKYPVGRSDERSSPILSRGHDSASRPAETNHQSFVSSLPLRDKSADQPPYTNGTPGYSYTSPRKGYDPVSSHRRAHDGDRRGYLGAFKDDVKVVKEKGRINGVKDSPEKVRDFAEAKLRNSNDREDPAYLRILKRGETPYNERDKEGLKYNSEFLNRRAKREEALKRERRREGSERGRSSPSNVHETLDRGKRNFPVTTAHSVETIMNGKASSSPAKPSERAKEDTRINNDWWNSRTGERPPEVFVPKRIEVVSQDDLSREQRIISRDQNFASREREQRPRDREQRSRDKSSEKSDVKVAERERLLYEASANEHLQHTGRPYLDPRFMNPGTLDQRGIDSRQYGPNGNLRGFDPRKYESRIGESADVKCKRNMEEQNDEKHRSEERIPRRSETSSDRNLPEHVRTFHNDEGRPRSAPQYGNRCASPRMGSADVKHSKTEIKSRGLDTAGHAEIIGVKRSETGDTLGETVPSKSRSPLKDDDVIVSKGGSINESSRSSNVSRPGTESSVSNAMRAGLGNLVMNPPGTGYPNVPMLNPDAYFQQLLLAQSEGRMPPMFLPVPPNGLFPHLGADPSHAAMLSNEYLVKAYRELFQDPSLQLQQLQLQRLMQEKALSAGKDLIGCPPHMITPERQQEFLKNFPPGQQMLLLHEIQKRQQQILQHQMQQEKLDARRNKDMEQDQKIKSEESEAKQLHEKREQEENAKRIKEENERQTQYFKPFLTQNQFQEAEAQQQRLTQPTEQQITKSINSEQHEKNTKHNEQQQQFTQQQHNQLLEEEQQQQQLIQQKIQRMRQLQQQKEQELFQQHKEEKEIQQTQQQEQKQLQQQKINSLKQLQQKEFELIQQQKNEEQRLKQQNLLWQKRQTEQIKLLEQQQQRQLFQQQSQQQQNKQDQVLQEQNEQEQRKNLSDQGVLQEKRTTDSFKLQSVKFDNSSNQMDVKTSITPEVLVKEERSRFQFPEVNEKPSILQNVEQRRTSLLPAVVSEPLPTVTDVASSTIHDVSASGELSPGCVNAAEVLSRFRSSGPLRFLENGEGMKEEMTESPAHERNLSTSSTPQGDENTYISYEPEEQNSDVQKTVPVKPEPLMSGNLEQIRCRGDLNELVRVIEEQFGVHDELLDEKPGGDLSAALHGGTEDDVLSDGSDAEELSPLSDYGDNDCWWWISRSPCVPSARPKPHYLEDKENIFAQTKRIENRQNICANINRLRKEVKRGLTKAKKDRYAALANHRPAPDAESVLNSACTNIKAATEIDGLQEALRDQLLSIQKTYRERHRELARLTPKNKDKPEDSPIKRGPGRPRKRKNCSNSKSNMNDEPDVSAANSPSADQVEAGSPSREQNSGDDVPEGGEVEESKCETDPADPCEDYEDETKVEPEETLLQEKENKESPSENTWPEPCEPKYEAGADEHLDETEVVSKKKLKKKRRRIISDSDTETAGPREHEVSDKPKKVKKNKKTRKSRSNDGEGEGKKKSKIKQGDDDVFTSENGEQGLNLLAKYSVAASDGVQDGKVLPKKRKRSTVSEEILASKQRTKKTTKLSLKSPPKDADESTNVDIQTKLAEARMTDPDPVTKEQIQSPECLEKSSDKSMKPKAISLPPPSTNDEFFLRRSERIFLSSSSSLNSPTTTTGDFEIPNVNKKKAKIISGKIVKKKDQECLPDQESTIEESTDKETTGGESPKKKRKVKIKQQEEKKKKKLKNKRKESSGEFTDDEYDEQKFFDEIKQLPKRNRHAPRRYIEYDSAEEKMEGETSANEPQVEDNAESESEKTGAEGDIAEAPELEPSDHEASEVESEPGDNTDDVRQEEEGRSSGMEGITTEDVERNESKVTEENENNCDDQMQTEDSELDNEKLIENDKVASEENEKGKAPFPWMFSMTELRIGQKMLLPVEGVYYPGRIDAIHVPDLYAIILDGERGRKPQHFRSSEQLLNEAVRDIQPLSLDEIPIGTRVCAYWSQQYRCFYPGLVSEVPEDEKIGRNRCWVEFDDGDSGEFPLPDVRMIPPDFPQEATDCESNSGLPEPCRPKKSDRRTGDEGLEDDLGSDSGDSAVENGHERTREKRRRDKGEYSKTRRTDDDGEYDRTKPTKYRTFSEDSKASRSNPRRKVKSNLGKDYPKEEGNTRDDEGEIEWSEDVFDDGSLKRKRFTKYVSSHVSSGEDQPKVLVYPPDHIWRWAGKPCPNRRKRGGRKVFYKSIYRGDEHISVGECAVFLSSPSKNPELPYVGKIVKMWERFNGSKVVRVKWFYHPEETKAGRRPSDGKNGLYLSSHVDENDVQTIAHKCEVLQLHEAKSNRNTKSTNDNDVMNNNIFWCLGTYDPLTETFPSDND